MRHWTLALAGVLLAGALATCVSKAAAQSGERPSPSSMSASVPTPYPASIFLVRGTPPQPTKSEPLSFEGPLPAAGSWTEASAPPGTGAIGAHWIRVYTADGHAMLTAVLMPQGQGPFPVVVVLQGAGSLGTAQVERAQELSRAGFIGVASCWHAGASRPDGSAALRTPSVNIGPTPNRTIDCNHAPELSGVRGESVKALMQAVRSLPDVRSDDFGIDGFSAGAQAGLLLASVPSLREPALQAVVAGSAAYDVFPQPISYPSTLSAPVLILHGLKDNTVDPKLAREYEDAARAANKIVESHYYEDGYGHGVLPTPDVAVDEFQRVVDFFKRYLA